MKRSLLQPSEEQVQRVLVQGLRLLGYEVLVTTHRVHRCPCGRWSRGDYGSTPGIPDLLVRHPSWPRAQYLGLEVKGPTTRLSPSQARLLSQGSLLVVRSLEEALACLHPPA